MTVGDRPQDTAPRPPAQIILRTPEHFIAFGFGAGLAPKMPGTAGTLVGLPIAWALSWLHLLPYVLITAALFGFGAWVCGRSARLLGVHDYPGIVFDEIVGMIVAALPLVHSLNLARSPFWWLFAFALFRAFDIIKPWPIGWLDREVHGGLGIMLDDWVAGIYAAVMLAAVLLIA